MCSEPNDYRIGKFSRFLGICFCFAFLPETLSGLHFSNIKMTKEAFFFVKSYTSSKKIFRVEIL